MMMTSVLFKFKLFAGLRRVSLRGLGFEPRRICVIFACLFPSFPFIIIIIIIIIFCHSYHRNNCSSRKDESFSNNRGQNIVTAYDRDINK